MSKEDKKNKEKEDGPKQSLLFDKNIRAGKLAEKEDYDTRPNYHRYVCNASSCPAITICHPDIMEFMCTNCQKKYSKIDYKFYTHCKSFIIINIR